MMVFKEKSKGFTPFQIPSNIAKLLRKYLIKQKTNVYDKTASLKFGTGFTLIELLIVIAIIAILAATIVPNFIGFDTEARIAATKTNLDTLRTRITLFRAKEGRYPEGLKELLTTHYFDVGVKKTYLSKMPLEMISTKSGNSAFVDRKTGDISIAGDGGWVYYIDTAEVHVNIDEPLDRKWSDYEGEKPIDW